MTDWMRVGTDVGVGGAVGVVDQLIQNRDTKKLIETPDASMWKQYGTYYNYGVPILAILATAFGYLRGDWATRSIVAGSQLAGRKATKQLTAESMTEAGAVPMTNWSRQGTSAAARARALAAARAKTGARPQIGGLASPIGIPVIADETILV